MGKHHHIAAIAVFLVVAALMVMAGATACNRGGTSTNQLTISSGSGGNVTSPGEGTFTYGAGTAVQLMATPDDGYQFRSWTGDIGNIADANAASTAITMNGNYAILANFGEEGEPGPTTPSGL